ncbi:MAG TPA: PPE family protein, partial [Mycobacterium sp.]
DTAFGQFANSNILNTIFKPAFYMPGRYLGNLTSLMSLSQQGAPSATASAGEGLAGTTAAPLGSIGALGNSVSAGMGQGALVGPLSVPSSWASNAPAPSPLVPPTGKAPIVVPASQVGSSPPVPLAGKMGAQRDCRVIPQYGFKPFFVARPPAAG